MGAIQIDIDKEKNSYILKGDLIELKSDVTAVFFLKDFLHAEFQNPEEILVPFEKDTKESILNQIREMLIEFGMAEYQSEYLKKEMEDFLQEDVNFKEFSKKAYNIRNNNCDSTEFDSFIKSLEANLPERTLYPLQALCSFHLAFSQNACNFSVPGAGKTSIVYGTYCYLKSLDTRDNKHVDKILVIGPLSSFGPWENEYEECFGVKPNSKRLSGGVNREEKIDYLYSTETAEVTLISYQGILNIFQELVYFLNKNKVMVVLDEAHRIKNTSGGSIASTALELSRFSKSRVILTGTPVPNGYEDLYNLFKFIWPTKKIIRFHLYQLKDMSIHRDEERVRMLIDDISPYFIRIKKSDLKIPEPIEHPPIKVEMGYQQRRIYEYIENNYVRSFNCMQGTGIRDAIINAKLIRLMQTATNPFMLRKPIDEYYSQDGFNEGVFIDDYEIIQSIINYKSNEVPQKFIRTAELVKEILNRDEKVIIWTVFIQNILDLQEYLMSIGINVEVLYGAVPIDMEENEITAYTRESIIREFHKTDSMFKVIIANPMAASESISLHKVCHNAIFLDRSFNVSHFIQSKDRIHRYGLEKKVNYYYILSNNSIDEVIHERLAIKEKRMMEIIENEPIPLFKNIEDDYDESDFKLILKRYTERLG
ncbi:DEAD/DEAH box helicase [Clostridium sp. BNL1100]|uniref:DEAD/DEAH box helicase n=1 Tax=Clostridium sp. BNL1100 TaxID=755731 RepID=UPI00024A77A9|nr:DEAD/DEAH box helicase [Clostridium sp. BNL1100]AEY64804.1 DNA/RNA helicase, superfamily II, SNF2 family [Clostridium sp. BNL1100]